MCYSQLELLVRGYTYVQMTFIGGFAGVLIGLLDRQPAYYNRRMWQQCFLGTLMVLAVEYASGYVLNIRMGLGIWDYSRMPYNYRGQICLVTAVLWFFLCPFAIWMDDFLRFKFFDEPRPKSVVYNYVRLFTFQ